MSEIAAPVASSLGESLGKSLGMGADVHERIARLESARDVLARGAQLPPEPRCRWKNVPLLPLDFEEAAGWARAGPRGRRNWDSSTSLLSPPPPRRPRPILYRFPA